MRRIKELILVLLIAGLTVPAFSQGNNVITIKGTHFEMNGKPFEFTGVSFFNAIYNKEFNLNREKRKEWIRKFNDHGINVLRVWCQWDNGYGFIDTGKDKTLYLNDGSLVSKHLEILKEIIEDADQQGTVILLALFSRESWRENIRLSDAASERAISELAAQLKQHRNLIFQVWNEFNYRTVDYLKVIKKIDPERIVTNSPGYDGDLGSLEENFALDYLSPHTSRMDTRNWEIAAKEIEYLIAKFRKPVVDDEPARRGTPKFGGPKNPTFPTDHILNIYNIWKVGGYVIYHHDMFQTGYKTDPIPENGIPAPGFSKYHDEVYNFLKNKNRYLNAL